MLLGQLTLALAFTSGVLALVQAPALPGAQDVNAEDRIYTADQTSNTITVIKPLTNEVLGTISLGDARLANQLNPQYLLAVNSHGLGFSQDGQFLSHVSVTSNTVTVIRTLNNSIVSQTYVDRASHEAFFAHDGTTVWVACRGTNNVDLVDAMNGGVIGRIATGSGPSKVLFSPDGKLAYVNHIKMPTISIIDVAERKIIDTITGLADTFSSDMMISADGLSLWAVHKMIGKTTIIDLSTRTIVGVLDTGLESNHPNFAIVNGTNYGFVTVAATNETKVYKQDSPSEMPTFATSIAASGIEPHGIWGSPDGKYMYWVNEHSDTMDVASTATMSVIATLPIGQESQSLVYVAGAVPAPHLGLENLGFQGLHKKVINSLINVSNSSSGRGAALITLRELDGLDMLQVIGRNLEINASYVVSAVCNVCYGGRVGLVGFKATMPVKGSEGCAVAPQVLAFAKVFGEYDLGSLEVGRVGVR